MREAVPDKSCLASFPAREGQGNDTGNEHQAQGTEIGNQQHDGKSADQDGQGLSGLFHFLQHI